jgi:hypothetical protein
MWVPLVIPLPHRSKENEPKSVGSLQVCVQLWNRIPATNSAWDADFLGRRGILSGVYIRPIPSIVKKPVVLRSTAAVCICVVRRERVGERKMIAAAGESKPRRCSVIGEKLGGKHRCMWSRTVSSLGTRCNYCGVNFLAGTTCAAVCHIALWLGHSAKTTPVINLPI